MKKLFVLILMLLVFLTACTKPQIKAESAQKKQEQASFENNQEVKEGSEVSEVNAENNEQEGSENTEVSSEEAGEEKAPIEQVDNKATEEEQKKTEAEKKAQAEKEAALREQQEKEKAEKEAAAKRKAEEDAMARQKASEAQAARIQSLKIEINTEESILYVSNSLNMREWMSTEDSNVIKVLSTGAKVIRVAQKDDWSKVKAEDGKVGYVKSKYLSTEKPEVPVVSSGQTNWKYSRTGLSININKHTKTLHGRKVVYWVAVVKSDNGAKDINTAWSGGSYKGSLSKKARTSTMAKANGAILAINGDAAGFRGYGAQWQNPIIIRNGILEYEDNRNTGEMYAMKADGGMFVFNPSNYSGADLLAMGVTDTWWNDAPLVTDGEVISAFRNKDDGYRQPRTAVGQIDANTYMFVVADGRGSNGSAGVSYHDLAYICKDNGAKTAYVLDGGGSSTIYFNGAVLNRPSDGSERAISDIIYVKR